MFGGRVARPSVREIDLDDRQGAFDLTIDFRSSRWENFSLDVYTLGQAVHPDHHVGYWTLPLDRKLYEGTLELDLRHPGKETVRFHIDRVDGRRDSGAGETLTSPDFWANPDCPFSPVQDLMLVTRDRNLDVAENVHVILKDDDPARVKKFYQDLHRNHDYQEATGTNPFLATLHNTKMEMLQALFSKHFDRSSVKRVVDVGCGRCLLSELDRQWPFDVWALDFGEGVLRERRRETSANYHWLAADVSQLPMPNESFDALFAGEVIEHVPDPVKTLREWKRVLRPGGSMIITTPNLARVTNRLGRSRIPFAPDHLSELTYDELEDAIGDAGLDVVDIHGFYLELFVKRVSRGQWVDRLQRDWNTQKNKRWMKRLGDLGKRFPSWSFGLIAIARKP